MTSQRRLILDVFLASHGHLSSEDLYAAVAKHDPSVGQATVYRTLKLLAESGLAREVHFGDGVARYEVIYGHEHHDHLVCEQCGKALGVVDERIEELQEQIAQREGWTLTGHRMCLYGICPQCQK